LADASTHKEFALAPAALSSLGYAVRHVEKIVGGNFMAVISEILADRG
jgi:microsomal dipeptidase-like Zn-dependent dipeptidase